MTSIFVMHQLHLQENDVAFYKPELFTVFTYTKYNNFIISILLLYF